MARKDGTYDYKVTLSQEKTLTMKQEVQKTVADMTYMLYGYKSKAAALATFSESILPNQRRRIKGKKVDILPTIKIQRVGH